MRVFYRSRPSKSGLPVYEQVKAVAFCCEAMRQRWGVLIGFGAKDHRRSTSREVNLYSVQSQANRRAVLSLTPIDHCPFCGQAIEVYQAK